MSIETLGAIAGMVLSLAVAYLPKVKDWYDGFDAAGKARVMGGLLIGSAVGVFAVSCAALYVLVPCSVDGAKELIGVLIAALVANQATYTLLVKPFQNQS